MNLSIVIPVLNEEEALPALLGDLQTMRARGAEIIVVDGGSVDATLRHATAMADQVIHATRGRARQMNAGARVARSQVLLFLHADARFPASCASAVEAALTDTHGWGFLRPQLVGSSWLLPMVAWFMWMRSRLTSVATGDQGLYVGRELFDAVDGYPDLPLMEDVAICKQLRLKAAPVPLAAVVPSSGRRWDRDGALRTVLLMWRLRVAFFFGADPERLHRRYYGRG